MLAMADDIIYSMQEEDEKEKEFLAMMGKRAPNMILGELKREAGKYREATQSAQDNNMALHRAITTHLPNLQLLSKPLDQVLAAIPSVTSVEGGCYSESGLRRRFCFLSLKLLY